MTTDVSTIPAGGDSTRTSKRRRRWTRRLVLGLLLLATLTLGVMRSPVTGWIVGRGVAQALGCDASIGSAMIKFDGRVVIRDLVLRVPGLDGAAGEFLRARRVEVDVDWTPAMGLSAPTVSGVRMYEPLARVSVLKDGSGVSLSGLRPPPGGGGSSRPPRIDAFAAILEFGEHGRDGSYQMLKAIPVTGSLTPLSATEPKFAVKLQEIQGPSSDKGLLLEGDLDLASGPVLELRLYNVDLARWRAETVPAVMRDVWSTLGMSGKVTLATLRFDGGGGKPGASGGAAGTGGDFRVGLDLADVSMNALIPSDVPSRPGADRPLVLTNVNGRLTFESKGLTARLKGDVEDMPAQVVLTTDGIGLDAPVRCELIIERFEVGKDPDLMPFAPPIVRENFARFSGPTAVVDARVVVTRGASVNGVPGALATEGSITFENGAAAFDKFRYPVEQMRGLVKFDDKAVELVNIRGRGPTGAIVSADGRISPPRKGAEMLVNVLVLDAPIDEHLLGAMTRDKREVMEKLFNHTAAAELARCGLTATPAEHAEAVAALERVRSERAAADRLAGEPGTAELVAQLTAREAELGALASRPVFELGGKVGIDVHVFSPLDKHEWDWNVDVRFPRAGVLPSVFPLPMILTDGFLKLNEHEAKLVSGTFTGLKGGTASVEAMVKFDGPHAEPEVQVRADDVPVDALLLHAVAYDEDIGRALERPKAGSAAALLSRLALEGTVGCTAVVIPGETPGADPAYDVTVEVNGLRARPANAAADGVRLEDVRGRLRVMPGKFEVPGLSATMVSGATDDAGGGGGGTPIGRLSIVLDQVRKKPGGSGESGGFDAAVTANDLDISAPFESLVGVVAEGAAQRLRDLRADHHPSGVIDANVQYAERPGSEPRVALTIANPRWLAVDALGGRVELSRFEGTVAATIERATSVAFDGVRADLAFDGESAGSVSADGDTDIGATSAAAPDAPAGPERRLHVELNDGRFESGFTEALVREFGGDDAGEAYAGAEASGAFTAVADITSSPAGRSVTARIDPGEVTARVAGRQIDASQMTGAVTIERRAGDPAGAARGRIDRLAARVGAASVSVDGEWVLEDDGGAEVQLRFDASAPSLDDVTLALLPHRLRTLASERHVRINGPIVARDARISWQRERSGAEPGVGFAGDIEFARAAFEAGVDIVDADGTARVDFIDTEAGERWSIDVDAPGLSAEGITLERAIAAVTGGEHGVSLRSFEADCHGGRLVAQAVSRPGDGTDAPTRYDATLTLSGARFAGVLGDLGRAGKPAGELADAGAPDARRPDVGSGEAHAADESRGWLDATFSLSGEAGRPESRLGGGAVRVSGGDVIRLPLVLPLMEMSNMALPASDSLDYADASFHIEGERVHLSQAAILSDAIGLVGYGTIDLASRALDLKFNTLAATRIPLWSDMWETVRNEIVGTAVRGTIDDPTYEPESLGGTRRFLENVFGPRGSAIEFDPVRVDQAARAERVRLKRASLPPAQPPARPPSHDRHHGSDATVRP